MFERVRAYHCQLHLHNVCAPPHDGERIPIDDSRLQILERDVDRGELVSEVHELDETLEHRSNGYRHGDPFGVLEDGKHRTARQETSTRDRGLSTVRHTASEDNHENALTRSTG